MNVQKNRFYLQPISGKLTFDFDLEIVEKSLQQIKINALTKEQR